MKHLIIGGTKGIGREILRLFTEQGESCIVMSRNAATDLPAGTEHYALDVTQDELPDITDIKSITYCPGSINLKPISSLKREDFLHDFEINVLGAIAVIKKYHRELKRNNGSIVMFSTVAVQTGMPFHASVAVAKAGIEGLTRSLAAEFAPDIRVNCIAPTLTETDLAAGLLRNEKMHENAINRHPLKRILKASEPAALAHFLHSENAISISGSVIQMDAGMGSIKA
jgi:NAD(P)-dependent dehydrogenase (short-subunit alcohol dehydrogenase family)